MKGVLLVNLGSPDSPTPKDVKPYLDEFLMDERVIDAPKWLRTILVRGIISIEEGLQELKDKGVNEVLLVPLYPHYAMSSYETVVVKALELQAKKFPSLQITTLPAFYRNPDYIQVLSASIQEHLKDFEYDHVLFSYHGIPERHIRKSDPTSFHCKIDGTCCKTNSVAHHTCYRHQCYDTTDLVQTALNLPQDKVSTSFQSRLAGDPWLKPYTDYEFERLAKEGKTRLAVITPAFISDCLETLEEIAMEGKEEFEEAGGKEYIHIPCLNDREDWVRLMSKWINEWEESGALPV
ncbi:MAG: ferrochelatase [Robiginitalea sp.]